MRLMSVPPFCTHDFVTCRATHRDRRINALCIVPVRVTLDPDSRIWILDEIEWAFFRSRGGGDDSKDGEDRGSADDPPAPTAESETNAAGVGRALCETISGPITKRTNEHQNQPREYGQPGQPHRGLLVHPRTPVQAARPREAELFQGRSRRGDS